MHILVTGGAGYIGSHTVIELIQAGHTVTIADSLSNSKPQVAERIKQITGQTVELLVGDCRDATFLDSIFSRKPIDGVIHFAGLKAVGESVAKPLLYYRNNLESTFQLCETMAKYGVYRLVFSSSATVYSPENPLPWKEDGQTGAVNPYGRTKLMCEDVLKDIAASDANWQISLLRYFNPAGANESGLIGEDPSGIPNNLTPYILQVLVGKRPSLQVYGNDYPTIDGTGIRDYIHVVDLAKGHIAALEHLPESGAETINLGSGRGHSVLEVVEAFGRAAGKPVPYDIAERRPGDLPEYYADPSKAKKLLGWQTEKTLDDIAADAWRWQSQNPDGYGEPATSAASSM